MRTGRPTKLTPETQKKIVAAIQAGCYMETAAAFAGIDRATLHRWLKRGRRADPEAEDEGIYRDFCAVIARALAQSEVADVTVLSLAAKADWRAAAWRLERKFPDRWGRRSEITVHETDVLEDRTDADLDRIIDADRDSTDGEGGEGETGDPE